MSNMKCPVCNVGYVHESVEHWCCDYEFCPSYSETDTETYDVLIHTRKALDVAKYALKNIQEDMKERKDGDDIWEIQKNLHDYCKTTIKQITVLEQKD